MIPFSPLEAHGPHLPIGTDVMVSKRICEEVASNLSKEGITTLIYPPQIIGYCGYTKDFPGSISVDARTLSKVSYDMLESLARQGFKHIMIVSFHLDPFHLKAIHISMRKVMRKYKVKVMEPLSTLYYSGALGSEHAGKEETSIMLHLHPELVDEIYRSLKKVETRFSLLDFRRSFEDLGISDCYLGEPSLADPEMGKKLFERLVDECTRSAKRLIRGEDKIDIPRKIKLLPLFLRR